MTKKTLSLREAIATNNLEQFIKEREAEELPPVEMKDFDRVIESICGVSSVDPDEPVTA